MPAPSSRAARAPPPPNSKRWKRRASPRCIRRRIWGPPSPSALRKNCRPEDSRPKRKRSRSPQSRQRAPARAVPSEENELTTARQVRCVMAQLNLVVGDVDGNTSRIVAAANEARDRYRADLVMLPELAVSGYPPEDLLFHSGMRLQVAKSLERLKQEVRGITLIAG